MLDPGAAGPLEEVYVSTELDFFGMGTAPDTAVFPSGTQELYLIVKFYGEIDLSATVRGLDGLIDLENEAVTFSTVEALAIVNLPLKPSSGSFADGRIRQYCQSMGLRPSN
jgi:hypothetical protein